MATNNAVANGGGPHHHHHEHSGFATYSPMSTLERQYAEPIGKRVLLFVRTNPNVYMAGGVESILKAEASNPNKMSTATTTTAAENSIGVSDSTATSPTDASSQQEANGNGSDPFSFLSDDAGEANDATHDKKKGGGGPNIGRFLKKVAKNTTKSLERGMTNLAIRADGGKSPDWFVIGLYDAATHAVLTLTESLPVPVDDAKKFGGLRFQIPLVVPASLGATDQVLIKVWIRSGAAMLQQRLYLVGQVPLAVSQLRQHEQAQFLTVTLQSNLVADGKLFLCVAPDGKFPPLCGPGWSLADPDVRTAYNSSGSLFHWPLDQAYGMSYPPAPTSSWLVCTERTIESAVVLPIAAAVAQLTAKAGRQSLQHAESVSMAVHAARHDSTIGDYVDCNLSVCQLNIGATAPSATAAADSSVGASTTVPDETLAAAAAFCSASWQRPDSIFEVDLLQPVRIPTTTVATATTPEIRPASSFRFFPKPVRQNILPALLQASGGQVPVSGLLGTVRLQLTISRPRELHMTSVTGGAEVETWECLIGLEGLLALQQQPDAAPAATMEFPVFNAERRQMGTLSVAVALKLKHGPAVPARVSPQGGLLSLMGLTPLADTVQPDLDVVPEEGSGTSTSSSFFERLTRQQQQLATMGLFCTHGYTDLHCKTIRAPDVKELEERATRYNAALTTASTEKVPSHEDRTPKPFRPSSSRSELLLAGLPFNVHTASLSLHVLDPESGGSGSNKNKKETGVFTNVTCGAPADHARHFGNIFPKPKEGNTQAIGLTSPLVEQVSGGLRRLEAKRVELAKIVSDLEMTLTMQVANYFVAQRSNTNNKQSYFHNHVPSRHDELQSLRWNLFEAVQSLHHVTWHCAMRRSSVFSQALGTAVTSYLASLSDPLKSWQSTWPELWSQHGYLVTFEGLLSSAGKELGMIEDASVGIGMLRQVSVIMRPDNGQETNTSSEDVSNKVPIVASPYLKWVRFGATHSGLANTQPEYTLELGVVPSYYEQRIPAALQNGRPVRFYPLLFEVGVDIRQWGQHAGANMKSKLSKSESGPGGDGSASADQPVVSILDEEDEDGAGFTDDDVLVELNYEAYNKLNAYAHSISPANSPSSGQKIHPLLETLYQHIVTLSGKMNHEILDEAAALSQQLGGGGIVFCKSGKDRTAMHVTYKQAQYVNRFRQQHPSQVSGDGNGSPFDDQTLADATLFRVYGTRLPVCEKNVGQAKYAFNSLQVKFMPDALKPPMNTLAGFLKGGKVFSGGGIES